MPHPDTATNPNTAHDDEPRPAPEAGPGAAPEAPSDPAPEAAPDPAPEAAADPVAGSEAPDAVPTAHLWTGGVAGLCLLLVAALVVGGRYYLQARGADAAQARQRAAVAAARQEVANLTDLDYRHAGDGVDAILGLATGSFRQQFSSTEAGFRTVLISGQVESRGQITQAAVAATAPGAIRVLVAAKAVVSNTAAKNETRLYRIAVTTVPSQGRWLVSDMDFVS